MRRIIEIAMMHERQGQPFQISLLPHNVFMNQYRNHPASLDDMVIIQFIPGINPEPERIIPPEDFKSIPEISPYDLHWHIPKPGRLLINSPAFPHLHSAVQISANRQEPADEIILLLRNPLLLPHGQKLCLRHRCRILRVLDRVISHNKLLYLNIFLILYISHPAALQKLQIQGYRKKFLMIKCSPYVLWKTH